MGLRDGLRDKLPSRPNIDRNNVTKPKEWMNKKDNSYSKAQSHQSAPLSSLRDPSEFAPPPKHVNYYGAEAARALSSNPASPAVSTPGSASNALVPTGRSTAVDTRQYDTDRGGWGGAISQDNLSSWQQKKQLEKEEAEKPKVPTGPYRKDTTGLRTDHLPPPPVRRGTGVASPPITPVSRTPTAGSNRPPLPPPSASPAKPKPPGLPPRLPPRQSAEPNEYTPPPPPSYTEATSQPQTPAEVQGRPSFPVPTSNLSTNTSSLNRLAGAGISVPALGVSRTTTSPPPHPTSPSSRFNQGGGLSELQSRFKGLNTNSTSTISPPSQQEDQPQAPILANSVGSAYSTFAKARQDPSKVSLSEAKQAATTANAVNQRYGAQMGHGLSAANRFAANNTSNGQSSAAGVSNPSTSGNAGGFGGVAALANVAQKKAPPPPPPSRSSATAGQGVAGGSGTPPPPVPMGSKPRF
ncbi:hypothetical protein KVT40_001729 [Elsinoe batatas]|uniref:Uncharacterized protein n=1 Tax=Elsinoe batatas TaxID=2601811 RepID=A0A8K0L776_9PEZI|nr:hypothetical protein KVT40_001729 [Elsinoe batatas]